MVSAAEHTFVHIEEGGLTTDAFFTQQGLPDISVQYRSIAHCKENCSYPVIIDQDGRLLKRYPRTYSVTALYKGRYEGVAYLQYRYRYPCGDKQCSRRVLIDDKGQRHSVRNGVAYAQDGLIAKDRALYQVSETGLYRDGVLQVAAETPLQKARLGHNPQGDIAFIAISEGGQVYVGNTKKLMQTSLYLAPHGDRDGVLALYPKDEETLYVAIYKYVNVYNKGVMAAKVELQSQTEHTGWLVNSEYRNIGFDPEVYVVDDTVHVTAKESRDGGRVSMNIPEVQFDAIAGAENYPRSIIGHEEEEVFTFLVGTGLAYTLWDAKSSVESEGTTYSEMEYEIDDALFWSLYFEGRFGNTRLGIAYLKNELERRDKSASNVSKLLSLYVDYSGLFSLSSSIRVSMEKGTIGGTGSYKVSHTSPISGPASQKIDFSSTIARYSAKVMMERGFFGGLEYVDYTTPSAVGFSGRSKAVEYVTFDREFQIQEYLLMLGYNEISYARRYETDLSRLYIDGHVALGASFFDLSSDAVQEVEGATAKHINDSWSLVLDGTVDVGYIWQQRYKAVDGLGYAVTTGLRLRGSWNGRGQDRESDRKIDADALELEVQRYDIWYGPYLTLNVLF